jgi:hypothetical protein
MNRWPFFLGIALASLAAACRPAATVAPAATEAAPGSAPAATAGPPTAAPGELVQFSGEAEAASAPFHLEAETTVKIAWEYSGASGFALWLVNDTETLEDPSLARVLIEEAAGQSQEAAQYTLSPGDYHLEVEVAGGPWAVLVTSLE